MTKRLADLEKRQKALEAQQKAVPTINPVDAMAADLPYKAAVKAKPPENDDICIKGICVYGNFDMGVSYLQHGAPLSADGRCAAQYRSFRRTRTAHISAPDPNQMSNSFIGLRGKQEIADNLYAVFNLQTLFNVNSGLNANGIGSVAQNNGLTANLLAQNLDGQLVEGRSDVQQRRLFRYQFADLRYLHHGPPERPELGPPRQLRSAGRLKLLVAAHLPGCERRWR